MFPVRQPRCTEALVLPARQDWPSESIEGNKYSPFRLVVGGISSGADFNAGALHRARDFQNRDCAFHNLNVLMRRQRQRPDAACNEIVSDAMFVSWLFGGKMVPLRVTRRA